MHEFSTLQQNMTINSKRNYESMLHKNLEDKTAHQNKQNLRGQFKISQKTLQQAQCKSNIRG